MKKTLLLLTLACLMAFCCVSLAEEGAPQGEMPAFVRELMNPTLPEIVDGVKHIACVGDSITFGSGVMIPDMDRESTYPSLLQLEVGDAYQVLNYGMSGRTLLNEGDNPYTEQPVYTASQASGADIFIIMLGTNDSKPYNWEGNADLYRTELEAFVRSYMELENEPDIYLMVPPKAFPVDGVIGYDIQDTVIHDEIVPIVYDVAEVLGVNLIDMYAATEDHPEWMPDGIHPDRAGNIEFAKIIAEQLVLE